MLSNKYLKLHSLDWKGLPNDDVGVASITVFQEIRPGTCVRTGDFVKEKLGGGYRRSTQNRKVTTFTVRGRRMLQDVRLKFTRFFQRLLTEGVI